MPDPRAPGDRRPRRPGCGLRPAVIVTLALEAVVGVLLYVVVFRPLRNAPPVAKAVASLGVMVVLTAA